MGNGVLLVLPQLDFRVHPHKVDVAAVVFPEPSGVEQLVVLIDQRFPPLGVLPDPVAKGVLDGLLFLLSQSGLLFVWHPLFGAIRFLDGVVDTDAPQVQSIFQNLVAVGPLGAVGLVGSHIVEAGLGLALDAPFGGGGREFDLDSVPQIKRHLKSLQHKLLDDLGVQPGGTQAHVDFRGFQVLRLGFGQSFHVGGKFRVGLDGQLCNPQLVADVAGQVLVGSLPTGFRVSRIHGGVLEDDALQVGSNALVVARGAQQLGHIGQVHPAPFPNRDGQRLGRGVHMGDAVFRPDGPFCEHIRLAFQFAVLVQVFQRTEQVIGRIILKEAAVFAVIDEAKLGGKGIVGGVQFDLFRLDVGVRVIFQLILDQLVDHLPQLHHAFDPFPGVAAQFCLGHDGVFAVIHFTIYHRVREVLDAGVGGQDIGSVLGSFSFGMLHRPVLAVNLCRCLFELRGQVRPLEGVDRYVLPAILGVFGGKFAQNHLGMLHKILVDGEAFQRFAQLHPVRLPVDGPVPLLQEDDVGNNLCPGVGFERIVGQPDGSQQVGPLGQVLASAAVFGIQRVPAGDKCHYTARANLVQGFGEKVVVNVKVQLIVGLVIHPVLAKWHIADGKVIEIPLAGSLKASDSDCRFRVEFLGNAPGNAVQLHAIQLASGHALGKHPKEVPHAAGRLQDVASLEAHLLHCVIDGTDDDRAGIVGIQGAGPGGGVFLWCQQPFQL